MTDVAKAIWESLVDDFMPVPTTDDWRAIAATFKQRWNFPNAVGAIDEKHVVIGPARKWFFVPQLQGDRDGGILTHSAFGERLVDGTLDLPEDRTLPGAPHLGRQPHVFLADEAFPLRRNWGAGKHLTREQRVYNYRLSRARFVVENAFGILSSQWRMYHRVIPLKPANVEACVKATCILHNFMRRRGTLRGPATAAAQRPDLAVAQDLPGLCAIGRVANNNPV